MKRTLCTLLLLPALCSASTIYVDGVGGSDSNTGASAASPFRHIPGDAAASGNSSATANFTGTIYVKAGAIYPLTTVAYIGITSSNYNAAGPVTIISGTNATPTFGTGTATIDGAGVANQILVSQINNFTLQNMELRTTVTSSGTRENSLLVIEGALTNVINNCDIHDAGTNETASHCDCIEPHANSATALYFTITNCRIYNSTQKCIEPFRGGSGTIANNICYNASDHCITVESDNNIIYGNVFSNASPAGGVFQRPFSMSSYGFGTKFSAADSATCSSRTNIYYNNLIEHCLGGGFSIEANGTTTGIDSDKIFNNTFIDCDSAASQQGVMRLRCLVTNDKINRCQIQNNIFTSEATSDSFDPCGFFQWNLPGLGDGNVVSHNLIFGKNGTTKALNIISGTTQTPSWANYSDSGSTSPDYRFKNPTLGTGNTFDLASQIFDTDPKFNSYPTVLTLAPTSPATTAGTNLSAYGITTDFAGNPRVNWSMGAYDHIPAPPTAQGATISIGTGVNLGNGVKSL